MYVHHTLFKKTIAVRPVIFQNSFRENSHSLLLFLGLLSLIKTAQAELDTCVMFTAPSEKRIMESLAAFANTGICNVNKEIIGGINIDALLPAFEFCNKTPNAIFVPYTMYKEVSKKFDETHYVPSGNIMGNPICNTMQPHILISWGLGGSPYDVGEAYAVLLHFVYNIEKFKEVITKSMGNTFLKCIQIIKNLEKERWILDPILASYEPSNCSQLNLKKYLLTTTTSPESTSPYMPSTTSSLKDNHTIQLLGNISTNVSKMLAFITTSTSFLTPISSKGEAPATTPPSDNATETTLSNFESGSNINLSKILIIIIPTVTLITVGLILKCLKEKNHNPQNELPDIENTINTSYDSATAIQMTSKKISNLQQDGAINSTYTPLLKMQGLLCLGMAILENTDDPTKGTKEKTLLTLHQKLNEGIESAPPLPDSIEDPFLLTGEEDPQTRDLKTNVNDLWKESMAEYKEKRPSEKKEKLNQFIQTFKLSLRSKGLPEGLAEIIGYLQKEAQPNHGYSV